MTVSNSLPPITELLAIPATRSIATPSKDRADGGDASSRTFDGRDWKRIADEPPRWPRIFPSL